VVICVSNPLTAVVRHLPDGAPDDSPAVLEAGTPLDQHFRRHLDLPASGGRVFVSPDPVAQGKISEGLAAARIAHLLGRFGVPVRPTQSRLLSWEVLRRENVVLLGHSDYNRWVGPLLAKRPFRIESPEGTGARLRIVNVRPAAGEPPAWSIVRGDEDDPSQQFALISMLPAVDGSRPLLALSGLNSQATDLAAEYVTDPASARELVGRLQAAAPGRGPPWRFQAVLRAEVRERVPLRGGIVAVRVL
jgi:hypothetical protein